MVMFYCNVLCHVCIYCFDGDGLDDYYISDDDIASVPLNFSVSV